MTIDYNLEACRGMCVMFCCEDFEQFANLTKEFVRERRHYVRRDGWYNVDSELGFGTNDYTKNQGCYPDIIIIFPEYKFPESVELAFPEFF